VVSFDVRRRFRATALVCGIAALASSFASVAQDSAAPETVDALEAEIVAVEARDGPNSADLIAPLTALGMRYQEAGDSIRAAAATQRALEMRYNEGLYTLDQAHLIRHLIESAEIVGDREAAWDLEQGLLRLAERHPDDLRAAGIFRDSADRRMDVLERYDAGEYPPEVVLGCYYADVRTPQPVRDGGRPTNEDGSEKTCTSGDAKQAKRNILYEAQILYSQAVNIIVRNERYSSDELQALLIAISESSYRYGNPLLGRRSLSYLLAYQNAIGEPWLTRIDTLVQIADWDLLHSESRDTTEAALAQYEEAYRLLRQKEIAQESIDRIFPPAIPRSLPTMFGNPLITQDAGSIGYIDVGFEVDKHGRSSRARIIDASDNATRAAEKRLVQLVEQGRFRPKIVDGRIADSGPIVVRYYFSE
jgi:hypothetical protein